MPGSIPCCQVSGVPGIWLNWSVLVDFSSPRRSGFYVRGARPQVGSPLLALSAPLNLIKVMRYK
jgi:hypothetical protein